MQTEDIILWVDKAIEVRGASYQKGGEAPFHVGTYRKTPYDCIEETKPKEAKNYDISIALWMIEYGNDVTTWKKEIVEFNNSKKKNENYTMSILSIKGTKVKFTERSSNNGHDYEKKEALKYLVIDKEYTIEKTEIHSWHTDVYLQEVPNIGFNSVQFEKVK